MDLKHITNIIWTILKENNFKSYITLTYPESAYPEDESKIKIQIAKFCKSLQTNTKKETTSYFYSYELQKNGRIHIHLVINKDYSNNFYSLKKKWSKVIEDKKMHLQSVRYEPIKDIYAISSYILKIHRPENKDERDLIQSKLGSGSRISGGTAIFKSLIYELYNWHLELPIEYEDPSSMSLADVEKSLINYYTKEGLINKNFSLDDLKQKIQNQLSLEICTYSKALSYLQLSDINSYLEKHIPNSEFKKYNNLLKLLSSGLCSSLKTELNLLFSKIDENKGSFHKYFVTSFKNKEDSFYINILQRILDIIIRNCSKKWKLFIIIQYIGESLCSWIQSVDLDIVYKMWVLWFDILRKISVDKIVFVKEISDIIIEDLDLDTLNPYSNDEILDFNFIPKWLKEQKIYIEKNFKNKLVNLLSAQFPMQISPKNWKIGSNINNSYVTVSDVWKGGFLLNGFFLKTSLLITSGGHKHQLCLKPEGVSIINKIQKTEYCVNIELLKLLQKYKVELPDYKTDISNLIWERKSLITKRRSLFKEIKTYKVETILYKKCSANITMNTHQLHEINSSISKHELLCRVLTNFEEIKDWPSFYYSYEVDFRGRLYSQQTELSPQGSKLSRSLIKFKEKFKFNLNEFMLYSTRLYLKIYEFSESELIALFDKKIRAILDWFIVKKKQTIKLIFEEANEPYLFLAACVEYENYINCKNCGKEYYTGFPIILDCSGSGPQVLSLLLLEEKFAKYLNLLGSDKRSDFYIEMLKEFFKGKKWLIKNAETTLDNPEFYQIMRKVCKTPIMTQIYDVSYLTYSKNLKKEFNGQQEKLEKYINKSEIEMFINNFIKDFWDYLQKETLFVLKIMFANIGKYLKSKNSPLRWEVCNLSQITADYRKSKIKRIRFKTIPIYATNSFRYLVATNEKDHRKIIRSSQANFIHSFDAFINFYILKMFPWVIYSNHDSWAVGMGQSSLLRELVREEYYILASEAFDNCIIYFKNELRTKVGEAAENAFSKYCEEKLQKEI